MISITLDQETIELLGRLAEQRKTTRSRLIEQLILTEGRREKRRQREKVKVPRG